MQVFVVSAESAGHFSCSKLVCADWPPGPTSAIGILPTRTVIDIIDTPASPKDFPGLFLAGEQLPRRVWLGDSRRVVLHSDWRSSRRLLVVDTALQGPAAVLRVCAGSRPACVSHADAHEWINRLSHARVHIHTDIRA